jgi:hypothetical protein
VLGRARFPQPKGYVMKKLLAFAFLATTATTAVVHAESLEEKKFWKGQMDYLNQKIDKSEKACGVKFTIELLDKDKFRTEADKHLHNTPQGVCGLIIEEVSSLCRKGEDEKAAVKAKIKGIQCGFAKPRTLALKGGTLTYMGNNEESNFSDWARPWLMKNL